MKIDLSPSATRAIIVIATLPFLAIVFFLMLDVFSMGSTKNSQPNFELYVNTAANMVPVAGRATLGSAVNVPGAILDQHEVAHMR